MSATAITSDSAQDSSSIKNISTPTPIVKVMDVSTTIDQGSSRSSHSLTEEKVRTYFSDIPAMAEIARCESSFRQTTEDGKILRGRVDPNDVGVLQINQHYHGEKAQELGFDIETIEGNMAFGRYLYSKYGVEPWKASIDCWSPETKTVAKR